MPTFSPPLEHLQLSCSPSTAHLRFSSPSHLLAFLNTRLVPELEEQFWRYYRHSCNECNAQVRTQCILGWVLQGVEGSDVGWCMLKLVCARSYTAEKNSLYSFQLSCSPPLAHLQFSCCPTSALLSASRHLLQPSSSQASTLSDKGRVYTMCVRSSTEEEKTV